MIALVLRRGIGAAEELVAKVFGIPVSRASRRDRSVELAAAEELVAKVFGIPVEKAKGKKNPNSVKGFDALVLGLLRDLVDDAESTEKAAIKALSEKLDQDWPSMSKTEQGKAIDKAAAEWLGINRKIPVYNWPTYAAHGKTIVEQTKAATVDENGFRIVPSFDLADAKAIEASANMQALYTRNSYGVRNVQMSEQARKIVSAGIGEGLDRYEIGKNLEALYTAGGVASFQRSAGYFRMIASVFTARARTWSNLSTYRDVGIETFRFEAVLDEVTTDVCRMMHGKTFSTAQALEGYAQVAASEDPEDVKTIQPWVQSGKNDQGEQILYYKNDKGARVPVANVKESGVGKKDTIGKYEGMSPKALQKAGISAPPLHAHCRSLIVPAGTSVGPGAIPKGPAAPSPAPTPVAPPAAAIVSEIIAPSVPVVVPPLPVPVPVVVPSIVRPPVPVVAGPAIPTLPAELADAKAAVVWDATAKHEGVSLHGVPLKPVAKGFWDKHEDVDVGEPDLVVPSGMHASAGLIIVEPDGRAWIVEPKGHFSNTKHTFPKGTRDAGESLQKTALREVWEESGLEGNIVGHLGDFTGETSITRYYVATRKGGAPWTFGPESQAVKLVPIGDLEAFLNKERDKKITAALREKMAADPKMLSRVPPKAPEKPKPDKINTSDVILGEQTGPQKGSNPGGMYRGRDGVERYVKFYENREQAISEHFANSLYRDVGQGAPETLIFEHNGKIGIASRMIPGKTFKDVGLTAERARGFLDGFAADVLTGNWDAVGTGQDNAYEGADGKFYRIDNGGALLFRARGERKPTDVLGKIGEWKSFFDPDRDYAKVLKAAGVTKPADMLGQLRSGYDRIDALRKSSGGWKGYIDKTAPFMGDDERKQVAAMLESRVDLIRGEIEKIERSLPKPSARHIERQWSSVTPRPGLTVHDLPEIDLAGKDRPKSYELHAGSNDDHPSGEKRAEYKRRADQAVKDLQPNEKRSIESFTGSGYDPIRATEQSGSPDARSDAITTGLARCTPEPGTTWRGIKNVDARVVKAFYLEHSGGPFALGTGNTGATSSSAWDMSVAAKSGFGGGFANSSNGKYRIYYKINGRSGVAVETISSVGAGETEVLFSRDARFKVTGLARMKGHDRVLFVELEEVLPGESLVAVKPSDGTKASKTPKVAKPTKIKIPPDPMKAEAEGMDPDEWGEKVEEIENKTGIKIENKTHAAWSAEVRAWEAAQAPAKATKAPKVNWPTLPKSKGAGEAFWDLVSSVEQASGVSYSGSYAKYEDWKKDVDAAKKAAQALANAKAKAANAPAVPKLKIPPSKFDVKTQGGNVEAWHTQVMEIEDKTGIHLENTASTIAYADWKDKVRAWEAKHPEQLAKPKKIAGFVVPVKPPSGSGDVAWSKFENQVSDIAQATGVHPSDFGSHDEWVKAATAAAKKTKAPKLVIPPSALDAHKQGIGHEAWYAQVTAVEQKTGVKFKSYMTHGEWTAELKDWEKAQAKLAKPPKAPKTIAGIKMPIKASELPQNEPITDWLFTVQEIEAKTGIAWPGKAGHDKWAADVQAWELGQKKTKTKTPKASPVKIPEHPNTVFGAEKEAAWQASVAAIEAKTGIRTTATVYDQGDFNAWEKKVRAWNAEQGAKKPKATKEPKAAKPTKIKIPPSLDKVKASIADDEEVDTEAWLDEIAAVESKTGIDLAGTTQEQYDDWKAKIRAWEAEQRKPKAPAPVAAPAPWTPPKTIAGVTTPALEAPTVPGKAGKWVERINEIGRKTGVPWAGGSIEDWIKSAQTSWEKKQEAQGAAILELAGIKPKARAPKPTAAALPPELPTMIGSFLVPSEPNPNLPAKDPAWDKYDKDTAAISHAYRVDPWHYFKTHEDWVAAVTEAAAKVKK